MDNMTHQTHGHAVDPHTGHKMSEANASHDRHAGHSVTMFRDKFWLNFTLTIPVVYWSASSAARARAKPRPPPCSLSLYRKNCITVLPSG